MRWCCNLGLNRICLLVWMCLCRFVHLFFWFCFSGWGRNSPQSFDDSFWQRYSAAIVAFSGFSLIWMSVLELSLGSRWMRLLDEVLVQLDAWRGFVLAEWFGVRLMLEAPSELRDPDSGFSFFFFGMFFCFLSAGLETGLGLHLTVASPLSDTENSVNSVDADLVPAIGIPRSASCPSLVQLCNQQIAQLPVPSVGCNSPDPCSPSGPSFAEILCRGLDIVSQGFLVGGVSSRPISEDDRTSALGPAGASIKLEPHPPVCSVVDYAETMPPSESGRDSVPALSTVYPGYGVVDSTAVTHAAGMADLDFGVQLLLLLRGQVNDAEAVFSFLQWPH
ncbi:hypothetical protein Nepgr_027724 [Nepenthes gracilis]|uniref:Uncharacterized protein n=1 Tax=Nepenthes gracilis TaxID=150966 RepID=A0AAD3TBW5_NEPGR|nr:hypothetical protein Nepgr_027724 [Nepenthes gracilis]